MDKDGMVTDEDLKVVTDAIRKYADERMSIMERPFVTETMINDLAAEILLRQAQARKTP